MKLNMATREYFENANFINVFPIFGYFFMVLSKGASVYQLQISYEKHD